MGQTAGVAMNTEDGTVATEMFSIAPAVGRGALWGVAVIPGLILLLVIGVLGAAIAGARSARFEISDAGLRLRGDLYGRTIPTTQLHAARARRVDFAATPELEPRFRTMGTGLPGYGAGWFRLRNGERALLYLTDRSRAVYVPTSAGYGVLLSPSDPDAFVSAMHRLAEHR
jgi:hypothetical protein